MRIVILLDLDVVLGRERKDRRFKRSRTMRQPKFGRAIDVDENVVDQPPFSSTILEICESPGLAFDTSEVSR